VVKVNDAAAAVDGIYYLLFALMYGCGLRVMEVVRLCIQDTAMIEFNI